MRARERGDARDAAARGGTRGGARSLAGFQGFGCGLCGAEGRIGSRSGSPRGAHLVAALADDDVPRGDDLPAVLLHAEVLRVGIAAVLGGAGPLLVRRLDGEAARGRARGRGHGRDARPGDGGVAGGEAGDREGTHESDHGSVDSCEGSDRAVLGARRCAPSPAPSARDFRTDDDLSG